MQLRSNEKVTLVIRKHWFLMMRPVLAFLALLALPAVIILLLSSSELSSSGGTGLMAGIRPFLPLALTLYGLGLLLFLFIAWTMYYLDMWIITTERLIDVEQHGLFSREISEIPLHRVQDVTLEVHGLLETFLRFGAIKIQTAGEREFLIRGVPHLTEIKDTILKYAHPESTTERFRVSNHESRITGDENRTS